MSDLSLGSRLKQLRKARGMTQSQLADDLFVSRKTVSSWETGRNQPDLQTICRLASYYQLTVDDLIHQLTSNHASAMTTTSESTSISGSATNPSRPINMMANAGPSQVIGR